MTTILVPLDDSDLSQLALPTAAWLARDLGAEVMLVTVEPFPESEAQRVEERAEAYRLLHRTRMSLPSRTVRAVTSTQRPGQGYPDGDRRRPSRSGRDVDAWS